MLRCGPAKFRYFAQAYEELEVYSSVLLPMCTLPVLTAAVQKYLAEMVHARRTAEVKEERHDLFSNLLDANEGEDDSEAKLSDEELVGKS